MASVWCQTLWRLLKTLRGQVMWLAYSNSKHDHIFFLQPVY